MLSFLGKVFLFLGAAFSLGALAGRNAPGRGPAPRSGEKQARPTVPEPAHPPQAPAADVTPAAPPPAAESPADAREPEKTVGTSPDAGTAAPRPAARLRDDPLVAKHRAAAFDHDFRTLDYRHLSQDEVTREKQRQQRQHSSWHPKGLGSQQASPPLQNAQFSQFGGSFVTAEIVRGRSNERVPDLMPTLPGSPDAPPPAAPAPVRRTLAGPDPSGPTPKSEQRAHLPEDPLVAKHRAAPFDKDFRTLDYRKLGSPSTARSAASSEGARPAAGETGDAESAPAHAVFRIAGAAGTVPAVDVGAPASEDEKPAVAGDSGPDEAVVSREPARLDAPRADTPDDLTRIDGIGPSLERLLFENGIYHFDQIAAWGAGEVQWVEARSGFPGRIARERWVEQARALIEDRGAPAER